MFMPVKILRRFLIQTSSSSGVPDLKYSIEKSYSGEVLSVGLVLNLKVTKWVLESFLVSGLSSPIGGTETIFPAVELMVLGVGINIVDCTCLGSNITMPYAEC